ncbi:hypothetical protein [Streptomyces achromogenes]|uniref:hypothetical protein n=1 Tax=Streptomyces achromogenes TaxID=67255 RepID=UPI0036C79183
MSALPGGFGRWVIPHGADHAAWAVADAATRRLAAGSAGSRPSGKGCRWFTKR